VGSSGKSDIPHLHFEVWQRAFYDSVDPWQGECGPNFNNSLWQNQTK
jgi:murein DD-endopeptidase MepM/ murein hydrolase activator NlpD